VSGQEAAVEPTALAARRLGGEEFLLCLGTNYAHKNRDIAIRVRRALAERGLDLPLILAGAFVPFGSSRISEAEELGEDRNVIVLPEITESERNWLLRHASVVLYPTSAEGFGLVPFEAARFGTPTVTVPFGPLRELGADRVPIAATAWDTASMTDATEALLRDPGLASSQVNGYLAEGAGYTWERTADELTTAYRLLLATPPRWPEGLALPVRVDT
jgi:glycosyltransferase involved in cell wall biosynthesis